MFLTQWVLRKVIERLPFEIVAYFSASKVYEWTGLPYDRKKRLLGYHAWNEYGEALEASCYCWSSQFGLWGLILSWFKCTQSQLDISMLLFDGNKWPQEYQFKDVPEYCDLWRCWIWKASFTSVQHLEAVHRAKRKRWNAIFSSFQFDNFVHHNCHRLVHEFDFKCHEWYLWRIIHCPATYD